MQTAIGLVTINLAEETAWMGFVQARLQARRGVLLAAAATAALFTMQHLPLLTENGMGLVLIPPVLWAMAVPFRALLAWPYNSTSSLFLVGLLHASGNAAGRGFGDGLLPRLYESYDLGLIHMGAEVLVGVVVIVCTRGRLGFDGSRASRAKARIAPAESAPGV